jgi:hypothetical protein
VLTGIDFNEERRLGSTPRDTLLSSLITHFSAEYRCATRISGARYAGRAYEYLIKRLPTTPQRR